MGLSLHSADSDYLHARYYNVDIVIGRTDRHVLTEVYDDNYGPYTPVKVVSADALNLDWTRYDWQAMMPFDPPWYYDGQGSFIVEFSNDGDDNGDGNYARGWLPPGGGLALDAPSKYAPTGTLRDYSNWIRFYVVPATPPTGTATETPTLTPFVTVTLTPTSSTWPTATGTLTTFVTGTLTPTGSAWPTTTGTATATGTVSASPTASVTATGAPTGTPTETARLTATPSVSPTPAESGTPGTATASASPTPTVPFTATPTPALAEIALWMPAEHFATGDVCALDLDLQNPGSARDVDLYVLLDVFGQFFCYPSWSEASGGLDHYSFTLAAGADETRELIAPFTMPLVAPAGPLYFYAALFEAGALDLAHLASNGDAWEFWLR